MEAEIPEDKVVRTVGMIDRVLGMTKKEEKDHVWVGVDDVQVVVGLLGFCGQILVSGSWKLAWSVVALRVAVSQGFAPLNGYWEAELLYWRRLLTDWNRKALMVEPGWLIPVTANDKSPFSDASRSKSKMRGGGGAVFGEMAMAFTFTPQELTWLDIADLEGLVSVLWIEAICQHCPDRISGKRFEAWCDNMVWVTAVNDHKSPVPTMAYLLEWLHELQAKYSFDLRLEFVASKDNVAADAASREEWDRFFAFMSSSGYDENMIVWFDVDDQVNTRSTASSAMRSMRRLQIDMKQEQCTHEDQR